MTVDRCGRSWFGRAPLRREEVRPHFAGAVQGPVPAHLQPKREEICTPPARPRALGRGYREPTAAPPGTGEQRLLPLTDSERQVERPVAAPPSSEPAAGPAPPPPCARCGFDAELPGGVCTACCTLDVAGATDEALIAGLLSLRRRGVGLGRWAAARRATWRGCTPLSPAQACRLIALRYRDL